MKKFLLKSLLVAVGLLTGGSAWADDVVVPTPVYFNDFSFAVNGQDGIEIVGNGVFENDADARFGRIFHNDPGATPTKAIRTNYLKLPDHVLSHSTETKEITIGFWVNVKNAADYWFSPIFSAYALSPAENAEASRLGNEGNFPMFVLQSRGLMQLNNGGYDNFAAEDNVEESNFESTVWLDDKVWHYYTMTMTTSSAKIYIDGVIKNEWNIAGTDGHFVEGFFTYGMNYKYICLGGNQAWNWADPDPAYAFDDFVVYDMALTKAQIDQIRSNKLDRSVIGTKVGKQDNSTEYLTATSDKITLKPGESYHYNFINYNHGINNWQNYVVPVWDESDTRVITVRADYWEDLHHVGDTWGSDAGCTHNFNWTNFPGNMNGATVDMTVTFTADKKFNMTANITPVDGSDWTYSYTNDYTDSPISLTSNDYIKVALSVSRSWLDITTEGYSAVSAKIGDKGWTTFASPYALDLSDMEASTGDVTAYYASAVGDDKVTMTSTESTGVAAEEGIMLKGTKDAIITIPVAASGTAISGNKLVGCTASTEITSSTENYANLYVLVNGSTAAEFQNLKTYLDIDENNKVTIPAGKAYLDATGVVSVRSLQIAFEEEVTGINEVNAPEAAANGYYNLAGQRVANPTKGLYIVNGKKVLVK